MIETQYVSEFAKNINSTFYWYKKVLFQLVNSKINEFIMSDFEMKLIGISEQDNIFFFGEEYFVTKIKIDKENEVFLRISTPMMDMLLSNALGESDYPFEAESMTELEAKILTAFNDFVYKGISPLFIMDKAVRKYKESTELVHITFLVRNKNAEDVNGKFVLSIPIAIMPDLKPMPPGNYFNLGSFPKITTNVNILVGKSDVPLYDIRHIENGDILVLERSNIKKMIIDIFGNKKEFAIKPDTSLIQGVEDDGGKSVEENMNNDSSLWDAIPVEIVAEFEKISISLGELKKISEGIIVDVGSIYENKILLKVEGKPVASGELIIINDKYAVRVDEVYAEAPKTQVQNAEKPVQQAPQQPAQAPKKPEPQNSNASKQEDKGDEDFDYDNFDIEDEDI